ncbi:MAG TPA: helicase HerA-like domain-containing protein [Candidatus Limnocylindria bacterium]|nr:helicase HerA-like domain-containing protein [Candidatus Limnocylindria bacterium]
MLQDNRIWLGTSEAGPVTMLPRMANRHGLISGATGTGKTVTLQVLAEGFSQLGVPVFLADVKGDLAGLAKPGELGDRIRERMGRVGLEEFTPRAAPVTLWDVYGQSGHPVRTTVSEMGPLLLSRMLQLNETQAGVLHIIFRIADDEGLLLIDLKDLRAMLAYAGDRAGEYTLRYGNIARASVGSIQRAVAVLEEQGGSFFFGEPGLDLSDWLVRDEEGHGMINILAADKLFLRPAMYSAFLLWMLAELYELLPEQGDSELPRMVFFFDEAHLLFADCPRELLDRVELTIRLIRSKGVGVFFITQNPADVPGTVLSQLAARVQHALRAFTPAEQKVIRAVAQTFRANPAFDTEQAITELHTGEALLSFLDESGAPGVTQRAVILPPQSSIGTISPSLRDTILDTSELKDKYAATFDRESAYEVLSAKFQSQGVSGTGRVVLEANDSAQAVQATQTQTMQVFDPATGQYVTREMQAQVSYPVPAPAPQPPARRVEQAPAPVLVYNPATGQYEPYRGDLPTAAARETKPAKAPRTVRTEKSLAEKMLDNFTRSTASGAGYSVGRTITRGILGVFGIK